MVRGGYPAAWTSDAPDQLLRGQTGRLVKLSEWAALCGVSRDTISSYVDILADTRVIHMVPLDGREDRGPLLESWVAGERLSGGHQLTQARELVFTSAGGWDPGSGDINGTRVVWRRLEVMVGVGALLSEAGDPAIRQAGTM